MEKQHNKITTKIRSLITKKIWFTVPYIKSISDKFENIKGPVPRVSFYSMNKLYK